MKFAHLADCHLGSWRQEELQQLNLQSFQKAVEICINEKVDFILVSGDLFDSAYPPIEILKETFAEFKRIHDAQIPVFIIAGSHDFSASGKTFLDVLEKAGFCKNVENYSIDENNKIKLKPYLYNGIAFFGYSGKKSGMEIEDLKKVYFDSIHPFTIFMVHTTISDVVGTIPMESIDKLKLPLADYYALGHIHQVFESKSSNSVFVYPGPIFPNNFQELADLRYGSFQLIEKTNSGIKTKNIKLPIREVIFIEIEIDNALTATERIIHELDRNNLNNKILLLKLRGTLMHGKSGDINFNEIEEFIKKKNVYSFLRNISSIKTKDAEIEIATNENMDNIEENIVKEYSEKNPADLNKFLQSIMNSLSIEKNEDEKSNIFESRLIDDMKKILQIDFI